LRGFECRKKVGRREEKWVPRETRRTEAEAEAEAEGQQEQQEQEIGVWVMER
jgi:hypothetical protein